MLFIATERARAVDQVRMNSTLSVKQPNHRTNLSRCCGIKLAQSLSQARLADGADLIYRHLGRMAIAIAGHTTRPKRVQLAGERAHNYRLQALIHGIGTDDQYRSGFGNFAATRWVKVGPIQAIASHASEARAYHFRLSRPSASVPSQSRQSSWANAI